MTVACSEWSDYGRRFLGYQKIRDVMSNLRERELAARKILKETECEHVVYGAKYYSVTGALEEVRYYMKPMSEKEFEAVSLMRDVLIFAVHKR